MRFLVSFVLGVALVAGVGGGALYAYGQQYTGRILPGVRVGTVDVSGLSPAAARRALADAHASLGAGTITLAGPDGDLTIGYAEIGRGPDVDRMLDDALAAGRRGEPVADLIGVPQAALRGVTVSPAVTHDAAKLAAAVAAAARTIDRDPIDATLAVQADGTIASTPSRTGRVVDQAALVQAIDARIGRLDAPAEQRVDVPLATQAPVIDDADVAAAKDAADRMSADLVLTRGTHTWTLAGTKLRKLALLGDHGDPPGRDRRLGRHAQPDPVALTARRSPFPAPTRCIRR